jgi:hypothetical protein
MCCFLDRGKDGSSSEAPSEASEFLPSHGPSKEGTMGEPGPAHQATKECPPMLKPKTAGKTGGAALRQVQRYDAILERMC